MNKPTVIAHRGASQAAQENTLEAFRLARQMGAAWVELDVRRTADDGLAIFHNPELDDGSVIAELALSDLPAYVPTLLSALEACEGMGVNIELKNSVGEAGHDPTHRVVDLVVDVLDSNPDVVAALEGVLISSFNFETLVSLHERDASLPRAFLLAERDALDGADVAAATDFAAIHPDDRLVTKAMVDDAHVIGLQVNVWTVNDPERMLELAAMGVDGICTDVPDVAIAVFGRD